MTVIAYKDGVMCADSASFSGGMKFAAMHKKVVACAVGLVGAAGRVSDAEAYRLWMAQGMDRDALPDFSMDKEDGLQALWVQHDGTLWWTDERLRFTEIDAPGTMGEPHGCAFVEGAMRAGASAEQSLRLALQHCVYVGGEITVVQLPHRR